jgi:hypothetical protein
MAEVFHEALISTTNIVFKFSLASQLCIKAARFQGHQKVNTDAFGLARTLSPVGLVAQPMKTEE